MECRREPGASPAACCRCDCSGQRYGTLSLVVPFLYDTKQILKRYSTIENKAAGFAKNLLKRLKSWFPLFMEQKELMLATLCDPRSKAIFCTSSFDHAQAVELLAAEITDRCARIDSPSQQFRRQELHSKPSTSHDCSKERLETVWETVELLALQKNNHSNHGP